jgi:HEAT repeat protein
MVMPMETRVSTSLAPFAAIQDPKRPNTPSLQELSQKILDMGDDRRNLPQIAQHAKHSDPLIRRYVAYALGQMALKPLETKAKTPDPIRPLLQQLSQDPQKEVNQLAKRMLDRMAKV